MSGPQFIHLQSFTRKTNKKGQSVTQIFGEARRDPEYSAHIDEKERKPPVVVWGMSVAEIEAEHDAMLEHSATTVILKNGTTARRAIRQDRHTLMTAIASFPVPRELVERSQEEQGRYGYWRQKNVDYFRELWGDRVRGIIEHRDEGHLHLHVYGLPDDPDCQARNMNAAYAAKIGELKRLEAEGVDNKEARKAANVLYKAEMRKFQDDYFQRVGIPCGLTREGPKRERKSRRQWQIEKEQARSASDFSLCHRIEATERDRMAAETLKADLMSKMAEQEKLASIARAEARELGLKEAATEFKQWKPKWANDYAKAHSYALNGVIKDEIETVYRDSEGKWQWTLASWVAEEARVTYENIKTAVLSRSGEFLVKLIGILDKLKEITDQFLREDAMQAIDLDLDTFTKDNDFSGPSL